MRSVHPWPTLISSCPAWFRMFTALLLLLAGQLGVVASAQAAARRRARAGKKASAAAWASADAAHAARVAAGARLSGERRHDEPSAAGNAAAILTSACSPAAALHERCADLPLHSGTAVRASARGESPLAISSFPASSVPHAWAEAAAPRRGLTHGARVRVRNWRAPPVVPYSAHPRLRPAQRAATLRIVAGPQGR